MKSLKLFALVVGTLLSFLPHGVTAGDEKERLLEYHKRGYTWPMEYVPDTPGWKRLMDHRFRQAAEIDDRTQRFEAYAQLVNAAYVAPNFTDYGFGLARAPEDLMIALRKGIADGLQDVREEKNIPVIHGLNPWFIDRPDLTSRVLTEMQNYTETWSGMELTPVTAYGFRLYRDGSTLDMHIDKSHTHVISFILHIGSSEDSDPWPIVIEDLHGRTHEVILTSGDVLFYESSKCFHGRPHTFNGTWYSSVFVHYHPKHGWTDHPDRWSEKKWAIPPHWSEKPKHHFEVPLEMVTTGMMEPNCPNKWCQTEHAIKWSGPGEDGYWITPNGEKIPFDPKSHVCEDKNKKCPMWAERGECEANPGYMLNKCRPSCGTCGLPEGKATPELLKKIRVGMDM